MGKLIMEEKALGHHHHQHGFNPSNYSLEERVSEFFNDINNFADQSSDHIHQENSINDGYGSDGVHESNLNHPSSNSHERTLYWDSQHALLQEILERCEGVGSKLRQEISRIIEAAREETQLLVCNCKTSLSPNCPNCLRKRVISLLCNRGLNATICVSKWKHTKKYPGGTHEYIEVIASTQGRKKQISLVIELEFREQFEMAKACDEYKKLVEELPKFYVGKADFLNAIVGVMCDAAKRSMEEKKLHIGPWRKRGFMQMKWSNSNSNSNSNSCDRRPIDHFDISTHLPHLL